MLNNLNVDLHTAALDQNFAAHALGLLYHAHQALQLRGESADDKAPGSGFNYLVHRLGDDALRDREARPLAVGGVRAEEEHFFVFKVGKLFFFLLGRHSVDVVELEVARKDQKPVRGLDDDAHRVGDGVRHFKKAHAQAPQLDSVLLFHLVDVEGLEVGKFFLALADHDRGQLAGVDRRVAYAVDDVGDAADVVEVAVGDKKSAYFLAALLEVLGVGDDIIHPRRVGLAELESGVDDDDIVAKLDHSHVFADFLHAAERDDADVALLERRDGPLVAVEHRRVLRAGKYIRADRGRLVRPRPPARQPAPPSPLPPACRWAGTRVRRPASVAVKSAFRFWLFHFL